MRVTDKVRRLDRAAGARGQLREAAIGAGMISLGEDGLAKVKAASRPPRNCCASSPRCGRCGRCARAAAAAVGVDFLACPHCGQRLSGGCPQCGRALQPGWSFCPYCARSIEARQRAKKRLRDARAAPGAAGAANVAEFKNQSDYVPLKNYYELLGDRRRPRPGDDDQARVPAARLPAIIPDKVQHLGQEFQAMAAARAAELTEAYRILMDEGARQTLRRGARQRARAAPGVGPVAGAARASGRGARRRAAPRPPLPAGTRHHGRFRAQGAICRLREAVAAVSKARPPAAVPGIRRRLLAEDEGGLFRKADPPATLLAKYVVHVDRAAVEAAWPAAASGAARRHRVPAAPRRRHRPAAGTVRNGGRPEAPDAGNPTDPRARGREGLEALVPPETPAAVRTILQRLRAGEA